MLCLGFPTLCWDTGTFWQKFRMIVKAHLICFPFFKDHSFALSVVHSLERVVAAPPRLSFLVVNNKKASLILVTKSCLEANFQKK